MSFFYYSRLRSGHTKSYRIAGLDRGFPSSDSGTVGNGITHPDPIRQEAEFTGPGAAPQNMVFADRRILFLFGRISRVPAIGNPLPDISVHVENAQRIGLERTRWRRIGKTIIAANAGPDGFLSSWRQHQRSFRRSRRFAPWRPLPEFGPGWIVAALRGQFPLGLRRQPVGLARYLRQPRQILFGDIIV